MDDKTVERLWAHIHALNVLATMGSFTAAAQRLGISKAAMSARIGELERAAGVPLVRRTTRSVALTEAGQVLADNTREAFEGIERGFMQVRDLAGGPRGLVRVTAPVAFGRQRLVPLLPAFLQAHAGVRVELDLSDRLHSLAQEGFDLAIRHTTQAPQTHVAWRLCGARTLLVASRAYLRRKGRPETPHDLAGHDCLYYLRGREIPAWSFEPLRGRRRERVSVAVRGPFAANNSEAVREAALAGAGIALLPDFSAQREVDEGHLVVLLENWCPTGAFGDQILAIRPYSPIVPLGVRALVAFLRERLQAPAR